MGEDIGIGQDVRLARIVLPTLLLREVDQLVVSGRGGYSTRQEFMLEAIQNHVLEVKHGVAEDGQLGLARDLGAAAPILRAAPAQTVRNGNAPAAEPIALPVALAEADGIEPIVDMDQTALSCKLGGRVLAEGIGHFKREPLLGLHNRDYPSLWALCLLADMAHEDFVPVPQFVAEATKEAWRYGQALGDLEKATGAKLTALFPTNIAKPQSAEDGFQAFAIGTVARKPGADGGLTTAGPLFSWQAAQLVKPNGTAHIGLTDAGWSLAKAMQGLTLAWPHEGEFADRFFAHLREHAPWDWTGFEQLLQSVASSPNRAELAAHFGRWQPDWTDAMANTASSGYLARARAWGLVEPKMTDGRYALTDYGHGLRSARSSG